jgi:hypothetical protein
VYQLRLFNYAVMVYLRKPVVAVSLAIGIASVLPSELSAGTVKQGKNGSDIFCVQLTTGPLGSVELYVSNDAARVNVHHGDVEIVSKAPTWEIVLYSKSRSEGFKVPPNEDNQLGLLNNPVPLEGDGIKRMDANLHVPVRLFSVNCSNKEIANQRSMLFQTRDRRKVTQMTYKTWDKKFSPEATNFIGWFFSSRQYKNFPLEQNLKYDNGESSKTFSAISIEKVSVAPSYFDYPRYAKSAHHKLDVLISTDANNILEDMWGEVKPAKLPGGL